MPGNLPQLVSQQVPTALGLLEIGLPAGAHLTADPGAVEGAAWYWSPQPGVAAVTISDGAAELRTPDQLLALERSLTDVSVEVIRDESGGVEGERHLEFLSVPAPSRTFSAEDGGTGHLRSAPESGQRGRYRFWQRDDRAVRIGYRVDAAAEGTWRVMLDAIVDCARLP